jgi:transposase InsO family protein
VDLCFVPVCHDLQVKLPAVSGSSGRLIVERPKSETDQRSWPGLIFADPKLSYEDAMQAYVAATRDRLSRTRNEKVVRGGRKSEKQALWRANQAIREERYQVREQRKQEDATWRALRKQLISEREAFRALPKKERHQQRQVCEALERSWQAAWDQHRASLAARPQENDQWQVKRQQVKETAMGALTVQAWFAVLVTTDNCTRQCLGLPLFITGPKVTAETVVQALAVLLPPDLQYLISDQGIHFRTNALAQLAMQRDFIWVPVARHRAQSNGIAERFVRNLKEWLASKKWQSSEELAILLAEFIPYYNARPHQGLSIPGLSPDEFAKRLWLM